VELEETGTHAMGWGVVTWEGHGSGAHGAREDNLTFC